jgi:hypothetical protein
MSTFETGAHVSASDTYERNDIFTDKIEYENIYSTRGTLVSKEIPIQK